MNLLEYGDIPERSQYTQQAFQLITEYQRGHCPGAFIPTERLAKVLTAFEGDIQGKVILDLGCGAEEGRCDGKRYGRVYYPWLCRLLQFAGAYPIGIDLGDLTQEPFEHHNINLLDPTALDGIPTASVDLAHCSFLFNSPVLCHIVHEDEESTLPGEKLAKTLFPQLLRVLKPRANFIYHTDTSYLRTPNGKRVPRRWPFADIAPTQKFNFLTNKK